VCEREKDREKERERERKREGERERERERERKRVWVNECVYEREIHKNTHAPPEPCRLMVLERIGVEERDRVRNTHTL